MAGGNDHLKMVNNVGGDRRTVEEKEISHFSKNSTGPLNPFEIEKELWTDFPVSKIK